MQADYLIIVKALFEFIEFFLLYHICFLFRWFFYYSFRQDDSFLIDVGGMIFKQLTSYSLNVRTKAAWSLGNFTDSVLKNK